MDLNFLHATAIQMVAPGKGLFAADESFGTIEKRFGAVGIASTAENRRDYREMLFRTSDALRECISGVILFDETIHQEARDGTPLVKLIQDAGVLPGIKVDAGTQPLAFAPGETVTEGLDGLRERLKRYAQMGARFAKWRAIFDIGRDGDPTIPSDFAIEANVHALARYAALCQEQNLVPVVEPDVLMDGDHSIARCAEATEAVLHPLFTELYQHGVSLEGVILKPNMVIPGKLSAKQAAPEEVAEWTIKAYRRTIPAAVAGVVLLSGGQSEIEATANLNAISSHASSLPWPVSFSYGRALQTTVMSRWRGVEDNVQAAQVAFRHRAHMNSLAQQGRWSQEMEKRGH